VSYIDYICHVLPSMMLLILCYVADYYCILMTKLKIDSLNIAIYSSMTILMFG